MSVVIQAINKQTTEQANQTFSGDFFFSGCDYKMNY